MGTRALDVAGRSRNWGRGARVFCAGAGLAVLVGCGATPNASAASATVTENPFARGPGQMAFVSPSGNLNCEIDYRHAGLGNAAFCESLSPPESATMSKRGIVKICGLPCEGNAAVGTPVLEYGEHTSLGPFRCRSRTDGISCQVSGRGFRISRSGISSLGAPTVHLAPGAYGGSVDAVRKHGFRMTITVSTWSCGAVPSPGTWSIDLRRAQFVLNSEPSTGQGQAVTVSRSQWRGEEQHEPTWSVVVGSDGSLEVTDGPTC